MSKKPATKNSKATASKTKAPVKATADKANEEKKDETVKDAVAENEKEQDATGTVETQRPANEEGISEASADKANVGDSPDEAAPEENSELDKANELDDFEPKDAENLEPEEEGWKDGQYVGDKTKNEEINNISVDEDKPAFDDLSHQVGDEAVSGKPIDGIKIEFILSGTPKLINDAFVYEINQQDIDNNEALSSNEVGSTITITRLKPEEKGKAYSSASGEDEASSIGTETNIYENVNDVNSEEIRKQDMIERRKARRDERQK